MCAFDNSGFKKHKAEARERWRSTPAYKEYAEKTRDYSQQKWAGIAEGLDRIMAEFASCTDEILAGLGRMYVADACFKKNIDRHAEGTAAFICEAIGKAR